MPRNHTSAKAAGTRTERAVANYLATTLNDDRIDRRVKAGAKDRGDIGGLRAHGQRLTVEIKDCATTSIPAWIRQAHTEAAHDDALAGIVIAKRRGTTDPGSYYVHMELRDLIALITGQPQDGRYD